MASRKLFTDREKIMMQELIVKYRLNKTSIGGRSASGSAILRARRNAWALLTEEFNSVETNTKRTKAQLKKLWENLKMRRKTVLAQEKRRRMEAGGGDYCQDTDDESQAGISTVIPEVLTELTDVEALNTIDSGSDLDSLSKCEGGCLEELPVVAIIGSCAGDSECAGGRLGRDTSPVPEAPAAAGRDAEAPPAPPSARRLARRAGLHDGQRLEPAASHLQAASIRGARKVRAQGIRCEHRTRLDGYHRTQTREDELLNLKKREKEWLVKAAEQLFLKTKAEREAAEEQLLCHRAQRQLAELELLLFKQTNKQ